MLEKTLESCLQSKEIPSVNSKGNQPSIYIGRTDAEAEAPIFGYLIQGANPLERDPDAGKD